MCHVVSIRYNIYQQIARNQVLSVGIDFFFLVMLESKPSRGHRSSDEAWTAVVGGSLLKYNQWSD